MKCKNIKDIECKNTHCKYFDCENYQKIELSKLEKRKKNIEQGQLWIFPTS